MGVARLKPILFLAAIVAYLFTAVIPGPIPTWALSIFSLIIVLVTFRTSQLYVKILGGLFLAIGLFMYLEFRATPGEVVLGFGKMVNVLSLFALAPIIAIPVDLGKYALRIRGFVQSRIRQASSFYGITSFMSYTLSSFMNMAALPMVYKMIRPSLDAYPIANKDRFASRAITHGYSMPVIWSPAAPILGIVVDMTGVRWNHLLPIVIPLSLAGVALDWLMGVWAVKRKRAKDRGATAEVSAAREQTDEAAPGKAPAPPKTEGRHPLEIIVGILVFTAIISWLEGGFQLGFLLLVTLVVIPFSYVWALLIGQGKPFVKAAIRQVPSQLVKMQDQFFVYLSAGFMITAIQVTGYGHSINQGLQSFQAIVGSDAFLLFIPLIPLGFAFVGLHPAVSLAMVAESLDPKMLGISVELTAIAMLAGAVASFMMGPYNVTTGMMSNLIGRTPYQVSNWNAPFTAIYLGTVMIVLLIIKNFS